MERENLKKIVVQDMIFNFMLLLLKIAISKPLRQKSQREIGGGRRKGGCRRKENISKRKFKQ